MQGTRLLLEEPIRMVSILEPSKTNILPAMTKIIGTIGPRSRSIEVLERCLKAGMSIARFDFSSGDDDYHQESIENLRIASKQQKRLCAVLLDTIGPELQAFNKSEKPIQLKVDGTIVLTPEQSVEASCDILPINYKGLAEDVKKGHTIFVAQYLFTGSETSSVWLEVIDIKGSDVVCTVKNDAVLPGPLLTMHVCDVSIRLPTLSDNDKKVIATWGARNNIDFLSLSFARTAEDIREARAYLAGLGCLSQTQIFAKIETVEGLQNFDRILEAADGVILSRGNLGIDVPPEKMFLFQKAVLHKCNIAGKPCVITRVVDSMTGNLRPTRAEATDVANAVLDGCDAIMIGAETYRGLYPCETIATVGRICAEAEKVSNHAVYFKRTLKLAEEDLDHLESIASTAVSSAVKVNASVIVVFTASGRTARLIAKYRPTMPVLSVVVPRLTTNQLNWTFSGAFQARQALIIRGVFPMLADPRHAAEGYKDSEESVLQMALDHGKAAGLIKVHDRIVVCQKIGNSAVVKIVELED